MWSPVGAAQCGRPRAINLLGTKNLQTVGATQVKILANPIFTH